MLGPIYIPKHFSTREFVDPKTYDRFGEASIMFMDPRILYTADRIRERYGKPVYINTYPINNYKGKILSYCGFRPITYNHGADWSEHRHGRALDLHVVGIDAETIRQDILEDPWHEDFKYITCIEAKVSWLHIDCRSWDKENEGIKVVYP